MIKNPAIKVDPMKGSTFVVVMDKDTTQAKIYEHYLSFFLPEAMLDFFELVWMETESLTSKDFPVRDRRVELHIRRRRWFTPDGRSVILNIYPLVAEGTRYSVAFAEFLKNKLRYDHGDSTLPW